MHAPIARSRARRLHLAATLLVASLVAPLGIAAFAPSASAADPVAPTWPVAFDLNKPYDIDELSRNFDRNEDGLIDSDANADALLPQILNPTSFSLHVKACAAPPGFVSIDWQLVRPSGGEPLPVVTSTTCEVDIPLPDRPYPDALEYDLRVAAHYPAAPDQVQTTHVRVQDIFMVGLGDSYGSGEGNPLSDGDVFGEDAGWDNARCHRSRLSGQEQAALMLDQIAGVNVTFLHLACSGAKAVSGILGEYDGLIPGAVPLQPQIVQAGSYIAKSATGGGAKRYPDVVVTSIGGNDAGFADVVTGCLLPSWVPTPIPIFPYVVPIDIDECDEPGAAGDTYFEPGIQRLPALYAEIDQAIEGTHPTLPALCDPQHGCEFMITEYPEGATDENGDTCSYMGFTEDEFQWVIDEMVPRLDGEIRAQAELLGWNYVGGIRESFDRHGICADDDWFRDIPESLELQGDINGSFHPDYAGHLFGYAPEIAESVRNALGFPYGWSSIPVPLYGSNGAPETCDATVGDGRREGFTPAPATDLTGFTLPSTIADQLATGRLPAASVSTTTCTTRSAVTTPVDGAAPREVRAGSVGCPTDPRPCMSSDGGSALVQLPVWTDDQPAIGARSAVDVSRGAGDEGDDPHRRGSADARATTVFIAAPFNGAAVVDGDVVVDLNAIAQASGANAYSNTNVDVAVRTVTPEEDCSGYECFPNTITEIASVHLDLQRSSCEESPAYDHGCAGSWGASRTFFDSWSIDATAGAETILDRSGEAVVPAQGAVGAGVPVTSGASVPVRVVRLPYSVPAGTVVTIEVDAGSYTTASENCVIEINDLPCRAQARASVRVSFDADVTTGTLMPLSGFQPPTVDTTAPATTASVSGAAGDNGWYRSPATVTVDATDDMSGVATTHHRVDGGTVVATVGATVAVPLTANGTHVVEHWATDAAGNVGAVESTTVRIDATAPTVSVTPASGVQVVQGTTVPTGLHCDDLLSGIATCVGPATLDTTTVGPNAATFSATDAAGNATTVTLGYTVTAPPPPPPPPSADTISLTIPQLNFTVSGAVTSGGFTIARSSAGQPVAVTGRANLMGADGSLTTVSVNVVRILGVWVGTTSVRNIDRRIDLTGAVLSRTAVAPAGANAVTGTFTTPRPTRTITWTITDLV